MTANQRNNSIDLLKGIGIILVVAGHSLGWKDVGGWIYSFHMPLFAFVGGVFFLYAKNDKELIKKRINTLLLPFFIWSVISWLIYAVVILLTTPDLIGAHCRYLLYILSGSGQNALPSFQNVTLWFLPYLFSTAIIHIAVCRITNIKLKAAVVPAIGLAGVYCNYIIPNLPYSMDTAFTLYPFFFIGSLYLKYVIPCFSKMSNTAIWLIAAGLFVLHSALFGIEYFVFNNAVDTASNVVGHWYVFYIAAFAAIGYICIICYKINRLKWINFLGRNSIIILAVHLPVIRLWREFLAPLIAPNMWHATMTFGLTIICCVPLILFINRYMKWSIGGWQLIK